MVRRLFGGGKWIRTFGSRPRNCGSGEWDPSDAEQANGICRHPKGSVTKCVSPTEVRATVSALRNRQGAIFGSLWVRQLLRYRLLRSPDAGRHDRRRAQRRNRAAARVNGTMSGSHQRRMTSGRVLSRIAGMWSVKPCRWENA
jgi:hypothetical protein